MPIEALISRGMRVPLAECPECYEEPFRPFMRGQVVRFSWFGLRRKRWALICSACKEIVDHEEIPFPCPNCDGTGVVPDPIKGQEHDPNLRLPCGRCSATGRL
jgi:hypothetical protein